MSALGNNSTWNPYFYTTSVYSFSQALTKVAGRHELRVGYDFNHLEMNHWQPEIGSFGPRGGFTFGGNVTGAPGYQPVGGFNSYASFLLGLPASYGKSVQAEEMTTREWQHGIYIRDRWQVNDKLTLNGGLRFEFYPTMTRADRGIERLDYSTFNVLIGDRGGNPERCRDQRQAGLRRAAHRRGLPHRRQHGVPRRLRHHRQPAAVVAPAARLLPGDDRLQQLGRRLQLHRLARAGHPADRRSPT